MLRIAIQSKGRLYEESMALLDEAGIKIPGGKRTLLVPARNFPVEVLFLRDDDIPESVASGVADVGIVGLNEVLEKRCPVGVLPSFAGHTSGYRLSRQTVVLGEEDSDFLSRYSLGLSASERPRCRYSCDYRLGGDCPRYPVGRRHIRHCQLGQYVGEQPVERGRTGSGVGSCAYR